MNFIELVRSIRNGDEVFSLDADRIVTITDTIQGNAIIKLETGQELLVHESRMQILRLITHQPAQDPKPI